MINELLKNNNLKVTTKRCLLLNIIESLEDATLKDICEIVNRTIDKSTVYRTIDTFLKHDIIEKNINVNNEIFFTLKKRHRYHITCIKCHKRIEISECIFDKLDKDIEGFKILDHFINLKGVCPICQKK